MLRSSHDGMDSTNPITSTEAPGGSDVEPYPNVVARPPLCCREIASEDLHKVIALLKKGFPHHGDKYWTHLIKRLSERRAPAGFPKYGWLLERDAVPVGVILQIFSSTVVDEKPQIRCNFSSLYVEPAFRAYTTMLVSRAMRYRDVTYINISPAHHTLPFVTAKGYQPYSSGLFVALTAIGRRSQDVSIVPIETEAGSDHNLRESEERLLLDHANYGCISVVVRSEGRSYPFVFAPYRAPARFARIPFAHLVYCSDLHDFIQFAGPLGRFLAKRRLPLVVLNSNRPIPGLLGAYIAGRPKYFKGPHPPHLGDLAYSELALSAAPGFNY